MRIIYPRKPRRSLKNWNVILNILEWDVGAYLNRFEKIFKIWENKEKDLQTYQNRSKKSQRKSEKN